MSKEKRKSNGQKENNGVVKDGIFVYSGPLTLDQLCKRLGISATDTIKSFLMAGRIISLNTVLSDDLIAEVCLNNDFDFRKEDNPSVDFTNAKIFSESDTDPRPPVVTIMGHVDHGKTTLIDNIRHSSITSSEHGGITQEIGAYQKEINGKKITFIDTPGHEAFTAMRARGASVTDIVILIVAADDGVKPQTIEAISHAKAANVPIIVAINKIDKPGANVERVKSELAAQDLTPEEWGGSTMCFEISAKMNTNVDKLLEGVLDLAELLELKASNSKPAIGSVIESKLDKKEGAKATLLVQNGTLHVGDYLAVGQYYCKVRRMTNEYDKAVKEALPSTPVSVTGLSGVPVAGDRFLAFPSEKEAREAAALRAQALLTMSQNAGVSLADMAVGAASGKDLTINLIVKADTQGSAEAIKSSLEKISVPGAKCQVLHCSSGDVTQGDLTLAKASSAITLAFSVKVPPLIRDLAEEQKLEIREYKIIYNLLEDIEAALKGQLEPEYEEVVYGHAEVRSLFKASKVGQIAGLYVTDGKLNNNVKVRIYRNKELVLTSKITSLKRFKEDVKEVTSGFECGVTIDDKFNLVVGDVLETFGMEVKRG